MKYVTAAEIAHAAGIDPKRFRQALRDANLTWYVRGAAWTVLDGSLQHQEMLAVLDGLNGGNRPLRVTNKPKIVSGGRTNSDEAYILGLCDDLLGHMSIRQHRFAFLRGDPGRNGQCRSLPVDAWYPDLNLVIEYRERQHSEDVTFFDRRTTVSGVRRGEQRRIYDQRRRDVLSDHSVTLVAFDYFEFQHRSNRRLVRCEQDREVVRLKLSGTSIQARSGLRY